MNNNYIRNFSIIAHIDHGKSTLADRILEITGVLSKREMRAQFLDKMDLERERGITIKSQTVRLPFKSKNGKEYIFNLIDTPGHVDFSYEVSRSLSACEGALLVVDASQGIEAQTIANVRMALESNLSIIPVINKIDLSSANPKQVQKNIQDIIGIDSSKSLFVSGKSGLGVSDLLEAIVEIIPPPNGDFNNPLQALIFDLWFDPYKGVIALIKIVNGEVRKNQKIKLMNTNKTFLVKELGVFTPHPVVKKSLKAGEVGFINANIKNISYIKVGDTITDYENESLNALSGFKNVKPKVFAAIFPIDNVDYKNLSEVLEKLSLNDAALSFEPETSNALGFGFRCGFLGLLHMEIIQERLEREFNLKLIITVPTVAYIINMKSGKKMKIDNPSQMPNLNLIKNIEEPIVKASIHTPSEYIGSLIKLCENKRGKQISIDYVSESYVILLYILPMSEIIFNFFDKLKTISRGYASLDYKILKYEKTNLVKIDILLNGDIIDALSIISHKTIAYTRGKDICEKMKTIMPRQQYQIAIQAAIGSKVIARETISALRKDVTAKCYGGDISRKRKLLEKQKKGKKRMKKIGKIEVPQSAFLSVLKMK